MTPTFLRPGVAVETKRAREFHRIARFQSSVRLLHATVRITLLSALILAPIFEVPSVPAGRAAPQEGLSSPTRLSTHQQFERGRQLMEQRKFAEAATEFREILTAEPNSPFLYNLLGFCALQQGSPQEAVTYFKKAVELNPDFKPARNNLGGVYLLQGRPQDAAKEFLAITRIDPRDSQAYFNLARAELAANQKEAGFEHLRRAYDLAPASVPIATALARLYLEEGQKELGKPVVEKLASTAASNPTGELELGRLLLSYGNEEAAVVHLRRAQDANPKARDMLYALAVDHFKKQDYKATRGLLEMIGPSRQNSAAWHDLVGECQFKLGEPGPAAAELQKAMKLEPSNEDYVLELSETFVANNTPAPAVSVLESATKIFPNSGRMWFALGVAYLDEPNHSAAEAALTKSLELDPKLDLAYVVLCRDYDETGNWKQLTSNAHRLIRINPRNAMGYYYSALALLRNPSAGAGRDEGAEELLRKAVELAKSDPEPRYELAKLMMKEGKKRAAQLGLEKIIRLSPDFAPAFYQLSRFYREQGEVQKSEEDQRIFERLNAQQRVQAMTRLLVEIHERDPNR